MTETPDTHDALQIAAQGHYDGETDMVTVVASLDGATIIADYDPSEEGAAVLDFLWRSFPAVLQAVIDNLEEQALEEQAQGFTEGTAASNA